MDRGYLYVVRGKDVVPVDGRVLRERAAAAERVVVDLGAGDGRWIYRLAREHPSWLCIALDANAAGLREISWRARRKACRGGAPNAWFVRATLEAPPQGLWGLADELHVHLPWGSLLRALLAPDPAALRRLVLLCRPGAAFCMWVNAAIWRDRVVLARLGVPAVGKQGLEMRLRAGYAAAGIRLSVEERVMDAPTSWGRRLGAGRPIPALALTGIVGSMPGTAQSAEALLWYTHASEVRDEA